MRFHFETLDSTNVWAKQHIASFPSDTLTLVTAEHQTHGHGQHGRPWLSPKGANLLCSFCLIDDREPLLLTRLMAEALCTLLGEYGVEGAIKWPNDVLVCKKKIAGVLTETTPIGEKRGLIVGVGLNINMTPSELAQIDQPATSLFVETGAQVEVEEVLAKLKLLFENNTIYQK